MGKLNEQSVQVIDRIVDRHRGRPGPVKLMLHDVQKELGYIPFEAMEKIAAASGVSAAEVYGVVTFYTQFTTEPRASMSSMCAWAQPVMSKGQEIFTISLWNSWASLAASARRTESFPWMPVDV